MTYNKILVISDCHFPFAHPDWHEYLSKLKKIYKPDHVIQIGDEADVRADRNSGMPSPDNTPQNFPISNDFRYDLSDLYPMVPPTFYPDTLSYRQGRNQRLFSGFQAPQRYSDNVYGDQSRVAEDKQLDAFSAIADAFGGDNPDDGSMDSSSEDNTFGYGIF